MRPGIIIQHGALPQRARDVVRCDLTAILGFVPPEAWPEGASAGDFVTIQLDRTEDLDSHPYGALVDDAARRAALSYFENGGETCHLYAVCVASADVVPADPDGPLAPLLHHLRCEDDVAILACPALAWARVHVSRDGVVTTDADGLIDLLLAHCRQMNNRFVVLDAPRGLHGELLRRWTLALRDRNPEDRAFGAVYYPWLRRGDELLPPSGAICGVFARSELEHGAYGVAWPPANQRLDGVTHTDVDVDWAEAGQLTDMGLNPIVMQPGRGVIVWGARTLSRDPRWLHINSRRAVGLIAEQLRRDNEWAVFEVNDPSLWKVIERDVLVRLDQFWEAGLLAGPRSRAEYSVHCGEATNPAPARDRGELNVSVLLRPVGTIERIHIDLRLGAGRS
jgi:hypothetical protein